MLSDRFGKVAVVNLELKPFDWGSNGWIESILLGTHRDEEKFEAEEFVNWFKLLDGRFEAAVLTSARRTRPGEKKLDAVGELIAFSNDIPHVRALSSSLVKAGELWLSVRRWGSGE